MTAKHLAKWQRASCNDDVTSHLEATATAQTPTLRKKEKEPWDFGGNVGGHILVTCEVLLSPLYSEETEGSETLSNSLKPVSKHRPM